MPAAVRVIDSHSELVGVTADQHHDKIHVHNGVDGSGSVAHSVLTGIGPNDHHARAHDHTNVLDGTLPAATSISQGGGSVVVSAAGKITLTPNAGQNVEVVGGQLVLPNGSVTAPSVIYGVDVNTGFYRVTENQLELALGGTLEFSFQGSRLRLVKDDAGITLGASFDVALFRDAAAVLAQRNGTNPQTKRIYGTYTDGSNYQRLEISNDASYAYIGTEHAGTGAARGIRFRTGGTVRWVIAAAANDLTPAADNTGDLGATAARVRNLWTSGRSFMGALNTAPSDGSISLSTMSWWVDETANELRFRVRYAAGTYKTGVVALV